MSRLLDGLHDDVHQPIVVAQHRSARRRRTAALAQPARAAHTRALVADPDDKTPLEPDHVYLAPPDYHVLVEDGHLALSTDAPVQFARPSIDVLFESAADAYGERAVGIVLTGANDDGAAGLARIKDRGGVAIVQEPATSERRDDARRGDRRDRRRRDPAARRDPGLPLRALRMSDAAREPPARRRPPGEPARARGDPRAARPPARLGHLRHRGAEGAAARRLRLHPARRPDAGARRLRARDADQAARALAAHPDHLRDRALEGGEARLPRLLGRRGRLHLQADRPGRPALEGLGLRRAVGEEPADPASRRSSCTSRSSTRSSVRARSATASSRTRCRRSCGRPTPTGAATYFNRRWFEYTGPDAARRSGPNAWHQVVHPDDLPAAVARREQTLRERRDVRGRVPLPRGRRPLPLAPRPRRADARRRRARSSSGSGRRPTSTTASASRSSALHRRRGRRALALARLPRDAATGRGARRRRHRRLVLRAHRRARRDDRRARGRAPRSREGDVRARAAGALPARRRTRRPARRR